MKDHHSPDQADDFDENEDDYLCLGVCQADELGQYCIGCGRPWHERSADDWDTLKLPSSPEGEEPDAGAGGSV